MRKGMEEALKVDLPHARDISKGNETERVYIQRDALDLQLYIQMTMYSSSPERRAKCILRKSAL
jgi:hypothetical protein